MNLRGLGLQVDGMAQGERRGRTGPGDESGAAVFTLPDAGRQQARTTGDERAPVQDRRAAQDSDTRRDAVADRASRHGAGRHADADAGRRRAEGEREVEHECATSSAKTARRDKVRQGGEREDATPETASPDQATSAAEPSRDASARKPAAPSDARANTSAETTGQSPESSAADNVLAQIALPASSAPSPSITVQDASAVSISTTLSWRTPALTVGLDAVPVQSTSGTGHGAAVDAIPLPPGVTSGVPAASATVEGFAALAALMGTATADGKSADALELQGVDIAASKTDAFAPSSLSSALPAPPVRLAEQAASVPSLGSIAMPSTPDIGFDDSFDQRIAWMADQRITQAEMRVSPEGIGPIDVRLQIEGHRVTAQFNAANADVRQALEAGMDRLRDLLGQRGMELADAQVGRQGTQRDHGAHHTGGGMGLTEIAEGSTTTVGPLLRSRGLIDEYV